MRFFAFGYKWFLKYNLVHDNIYISTLIKKNRTELTNSKVGIKVHESNVLRGEMEQINFFHFSCFIPELILQNNTFFWF